MHKIKVKENIIRTDLVLEDNSKNITNQTKKKYKDIEIINCKKDKYNYTTIYLDDITDTISFYNIEKVLIEELNKYIKVDKKDIILVIGLGNNKSTPDSLGPKTIDNVLPTRYLFELGEVEEEYSNVSVYSPNVLGNTGIESISIIKAIIKDIKATKVIVIDSLKANNLKRLIKTIQITDSGIHPGSGINNNRGEISKETINCDVIAIGIPTVVDINTITNKNDKSFIVTPTNIDFVIEKFSKLLSESINIVLHKVINRQINH